MGADTGRKEQKARHASVFLFLNTDTCRAFSFQTLGLARNKKARHASVFFKNTDACRAFPFQQLHASSGNFSTGQ